MRDTGIPSVKTTLRYGVENEPVVTSARVADGRHATAPLELDETIDAATLSPDAARADASSKRTAVDARTTVLPRRRAATASAVEQRPRFDRVRTLGEGGMGQVDLVRDNDIRRTVAVKRLHDAQSDSALLRFADEVRIVGQLEHPAIVPVYDVGQDDSGQVYLVMKHLTGETMEQIIEKLRAGDPSYAERFTHEQRVHLFLSVLDALRYAHARGVIHRDLKPANIMIGPYGEVTVLDWGIAKPIRGGGAATPEAAHLERTAIDTNGARLQETQLGSLAGTPLYMSPEQAAGRNDELDERSDVYALGVVFFEWLLLEHPIQRPGTLTEVLSTIIAGLDPAKVGERLVLGGAGADWAAVISKAMSKRPEDRYASVAELEREVKQILDGRGRVVCHVTLTKRVAHEILHWIDRHPMAYLLMFYGALLCAVVALAYAGLRALF